MTWPLYSGPHFCSYRKVTASLKKTVDGARWIERCRCGRYVAIDCKFIVEGRKFPEIRKDWFNADGVLERTSGITGTQTTNNE